MKVSAKGISAEGSEYELKSLLLMGIDLGPRGVG